MFIAFYSFTNGYQCPCCRREYKEYDEFVTLDELKQWNQKQKENSKLSYDEFCIDYVFRLDDAIPLE